MRSSLDLLLNNLGMILGYRSLARHRHRHGWTSRSTDRLELNTYGLPEGEDVAKELRAWFRLQKMATFRAIAQSGLLPLHLPRLQSREWLDPMVASMVPLLTPYWVEAYSESKLRFSRSRAVFVPVVNPHLRHQIERQSFNFCRSTNESTSLKLEDALDALKHELAQGLVEQSESIPELARRVRSIFTGLTERHAATIARTEVSRAIHTAQEQAALESGVVAGKELLISADACDVCQAVATEAKIVRLGQPFAIIGTHPEYSTIMSPPIHPNCRCSMVDVLMPEYGGPTNVEWGLTLFQPQESIEGGEYKPPRGLEVPEPEPERIKEKPRVEPLAPPEAKGVPGVTYYGPISDEYRKDAESAVNGLPDRVKGVLAKGGVSFGFGHSLSDIIPDLAGKAPEGWLEGMTWDYAEGLYDRRSSRIAVSQTRLISPDRRVNTSRFIGTILHETGHGYDDSLGYASRSPKFVEAYRIDTFNIDPLSREKLAYFLQPGYRGQEETFAELFSQELSKGTVYERLAQHFPRSLAFVRDLIK